MNRICKSAILRFTNCIFEINHRNASKKRANCKNTHCILGDASAEFVMANIKEFSRAKKAENACIIAKKRELSDE